ncbi:hypothetical protein HN371_11350 [Candidatus Poribacteria bacterium]|jgi:hypothetical protein|nr:hypothetical protein [Candidatus Poribacteria bacterium]MBT5533037.1 hypothetical protein [Candidatus Poribacteria bacterium]MBT7097238.1 hypothetical protein [Candidatus Poribacteria bacterium]MBT7808093.1 hypothetical protein [Candidatus Poribacteria bacterium]
MLVMEAIVAIVGFVFLGGAVAAFATYSYHVKKLKAQSTPQADMAALREEMAAIGARLDSIDERLADAALQSNDAAPRLAERVDD